MKKGIAASVSILIFSLTLLASPLVFKTSKVVNSETDVEIATFDGAKYRQLRINLIIDMPGTGLCKNERTVSERARAVIDLQGFQRDYDRNKDLFDRGVISKTNMDPFQQSLKYAQDKVDRLNYSSNNCALMSVIGGDLDELVTLDSLIGDNNRLSKTFVLDSPPSKIIFKGFGRATYKIFIWGQ